ncbi:uncharacterized protein LOC132703493 isoform X2 [Cylas formicarius]|nr:uncharacterized protein LOC132703493 isoform X2 [Cylas formicarius]
MERLSIDVALGDYTVSWGGAKNNDVELKIDANDNNQFEARRKGDRDGKHNMYSMLISFKTAMLTTVMVAALKLVTLKSIILAKMALMISIIALLSKLKNEHHRPHYIEIEERAPVHSYGYHDHRGHVDHEASSSNLYNDVIYAPSAASQGASHYSPDDLMNKTALYPTHGLQRRQSRVSDENRKFPLWSIGTIKKISPTRRR